MKNKSIWLVPILLIIMTIIPALGGIIRLVGIANGNQSPEGLRFYNEPVVTFLHIISSLVFGIFGAFQFSNGIRSKYKNWHRTSGRLLIPAGFISALTGIYMTVFFPKLETDGPTLFYVRMVVGILMTICLCFAVNAILEKKFNIHGEWMMRGYALGLGAATQVITHLPWIIPTGNLPLVS
jgi:O-antigen/teichoic acid export membrane protein